MLVYYVHKMFEHLTGDCKSLKIYPIPPVHYFWSGIQQVPLIIALCTRARQGRGELRGRSNKRSLEHNQNSIINHCQTKHVRLQYHFHNTAVGITGTRSGWNIQFDEKNTSRYSNTYCTRSEYHTQLAKMNSDKIALTGGVYFFIYTRSLVVYIRCQMS